MKDIAIYGAGGFGKEIACLINRINREQGETWRIKGFFDDGFEKGTRVSHFGTILGGIDDVNNISSPLSVVIAIANPKTIHHLVNSIDNVNIDYPNIVCPNTYLSDPTTFSIGRGNIIQSDCKCSCDVRIGDFNVFNGSVVLGHDVKVGSFNSFMPGVRVSGEVAIGNCNFFGVGSIVLQQIRIGDEIKLGAGSVLMRKPKNCGLYMGNPAKKIEL